MLIMTQTKCSVCGKTFNGFVQYVKRTCQRCGKVYDPICDECANEGCRCGGRLQTDQERHGNIYFY